MRIETGHLILLSILLLCPLVHSDLRAQEKTPVTRADSIMRQVIHQAPIYEHVLESYEAETYVKGRTHVPRKNKLLRYAYLVFPIERHPRDAFFEMSGLTRYDAPNHYRNEIVAINSSHLAAGRHYKEIASFVNLNVYSPTIYNKGMIMPLSPDAFKYYTFRQEGTDTISGIPVYNIRFTPRQWSQKLLSGNLYVTDELWTIDRIEIQGHSSFSEFNLSIRFNRDEKHFILPEEADLQVCYHALGNRIESDIHAAFRYKSISWVEEDHESRKLYSLDQTQYYTITSDTLSFTQDSAYWNSRRDKPLTTDEKALYTTGTNAVRTEADSSVLTRYLQLGERLTSTVNKDYKSTRVKYSGLLNPFQLSFGSNGITYKQEARISKTFEHDRQLRFHPEIGFLFKEKELRLRLTTDWEYRPERQGILNLTIANDNQSYSSEVIHQINEILKDTPIRFDDLNLKYFQHYYAKLMNQIELMNGFWLSAGLAYHHRTPVKKNKDTGLDIKDHNEFTPVIGLTYTPRQYYWMDGYRKEYLHSHYPTFRIELARSIPDLLGCTGNYWRIEAGMNQTVRLGLSERLSYNLSGGLFFNQHNMYFADFSYFAKRYFPEPWDDRFGGIFHNLGGDWYNASDKYIQGHLMYESPFILLRFLKPNPKAHKYLVSERFYLSQLWTPVLPNYSELGYGIGSDLFHIAFFLGFEEFKYQSVGLKFALELFR